MGKKRIKYDPNQVQLGLDKGPPTSVKPEGRDALFHILSSSADDGAVSPEQDHHDLAVCHATILHAERFGVERSLSLLIMYRRNLHLLLEVKSWAKLAETRYGIGRAHAHRLIKHAELCIDLSGGGIRLLPTEIQARKLLALKTTAEVVRRIWQMASCGVEDVSPVMLDRAIETFFPKKKATGDEPEEKKQESPQGEAKPSPVVFVPSVELEPVLLKLAGEQNLTVQAYLEKLIRDAAQKSESKAVPSKSESPKASLPTEKGSDQTTSPAPSLVPKPSQHSPVDASLTTVLGQEPKPALPRMRCATAKGSRLKTPPKEPLPLKLFENLKKKMA